MSLLENQVEIAHPQQPHCAVVLLLDRSDSMAGEKLKQLNDGLMFLVKDILSNDIARKRVDLSIISFGEQVQLLQDFTAVDERLELSITEANGATPMGEAIMLAADKIEERKKQYKAMGTNYYRPWIFMITDGEPTDIKPGELAWNNVIQTVHNGEINKKFLFFCVAVEPANTQILKQIAPPNRPPLRLTPGMFKECFLWLSKSIQRVSVERIGNQVALEDPGKYGMTMTIPTD